MMAGCGFVAKNFTLVLAPSHSSDLLLAPMFVAGVLLTFWMLVKGVDIEHWRLQLAPSSERSTPKAEIAYLGYSRVRLGAGRFERAHSYSAELINFLRRRCNTLRDAASLGREFAPA
jgi:hypothetical protein